MGLGRLQGKEKEQRGGDGRRGGEEEGWGREGEGGKGKGEKGEKNKEGGTPGREEDRRGNEERRRGTVKGRGKGGDEDMAGDGRAEEFVPYEKAIRSGILQLHLSTVSLCKCTQL